MRSSRARSAHEGQTRSAVEPQGIGTVVSQLVKLDFSLTQRLSVRAETGTSSGLGLFYRFSWD